MNITDTLKELGSQIGVPDLALNDDGFLSVDFDDITVTFQSLDEGRGLRLASDFGVLDLAEPDEPLLQSLLEGNMLGIATGGAHFSIDPSGGNLIFERALRTDTLDVIGLTSAVESFVNHIEGWTAKLN